MKQHHVTSWLAFSYHSLWAVAQHWRIKKEKFFKGAEREQRGGSTGQSDWYPYRGPKFHSQNPNQTAHNCI
ncbi:hypothetical protein ACRRTK_023682 [Alexandromys fortis]